MVHSISLEPFVCSSWDHIYLETELILLSIKQNNHHMLISFRGQCNGI